MLFFNQLDEAKIRGGKGGLNKNKKSQYNIYQLFKKYFSSTMEVENSGKGGERWRD